MREYTQEHVRAVEKNGIGLAMFYKRINEYGWTVEEAMTKPLKQGKPRTSDYHKYKELCLKNEITQWTFRKRIERGMTPEEAAYTPKSKFGRKIKP